MLLLRDHKLINRDCMPVNLLSCITARFNVGALHVFNVEKMMRNNKQRSGGLLLRASILELGPLGRGGPRSGRDLIIGRRLRDGRICGTKADFRKVRCGGYGSGFGCLRNGG